MNCLAGKLFVRVPEFWTADWIFKVAKKLGPIDQSKFAQKKHLLFIIHSDFIQNAFCFDISQGTLKFEIGELNIRSAQITMHASINHEEKRTDKTSDVLMKHGDLNIALPTNILNTSSVLK